MYPDLDAMHYEIALSPFLKTLKPKRCQESMAFSFRLLDVKGMTAFLNMAIATSNGILQRYYQYEEMERQIETNLEAKRRRVQLKLDELASKQEAQKDTARKFNEAINNQILVQELERKEILLGNYNSGMPRMLRRNSGPLPSIKPQNELAELETIQKEMDYLDSTSSLQQTNTSRAAPAIPERPPIIPPKKLS